MDAKEIYQAVLADCIVQINRIKEEYGEALVATICDRLSEQYSSRIENIERENRKLAARLEKLEAVLQSEGNSFKDSRRYTTRSTDRIQIDNMIKLYGFEFDGWYYYENKKMGNFLYRVKTDGTCNQQITDYSVCMSVSMVKVKDRKLYFKDADFKQRVLDLDSL